MTKLNPKQLILVVSVGIISSLLIIGSTAPAHDSLAAIFGSETFPQYFGSILVINLLSLFLVSILSVSLSGRTENIAQDIREIGRVKWFNGSKGFGFITREQGDDIFVHFRSIRGVGHRTLAEGQEVEFTVSEGEKGLQADDVIPTTK